MTDYIACLFNDFHLTLFIIDIANELLCLQNQLGDAHGQYIW